MDVVYNLINETKFFKRSFEEKLELKNRGRPLPDLVIEMSGNSRGKPYKRQFNRDIYSRNSWICGCNHKNALYCFPCLLCGGDKAWTSVGVTDLVHLSEKIKKHENSKTHLYNQIEFALLGTENIRFQFDSAYWLNIKKHNEDVAKNRYVVSKIIDCIIFCGAFELALQGHDESDTSRNPGVFRSLINFSAEFDKTLEEHLKNGTVFKGTSKEIQNDLLDCILKICQEQIKIEISEAPFLAVIADETNDASARSQLVTIFRYTKNGEPVERFWSYSQILKYDAESLAENILSTLDAVIGNTPYKLIAQSYDGATVMSGQHGGVQAKIKDKFPLAYFVHCYAHQLNLVMTQAASSNSQVRVFFGNLHDISAFFSHSPQCVAVFDRIVDTKLHHETLNRWNFNIRTVNVVFEHRESLIECMEEIEDQFCNQTVCSQASAIRRMLQDQAFVFWLTFFHYVMPHVDILFHQLQKKIIDPTEVERVTENFEYNIAATQNTIDEIINEASNLSVDYVEHKRKRPCNSRIDNRVAALEVCDVIINTARNRFSFKDHLLAASLIIADKFKEYNNVKFPDAQLEATCAVYPALNKERLKTELSVIYSRLDCRQLQGAVPFLKFLVQNNLEEPMRETKKLLEIVTTTPMATSESERCFFTLKRVHTFLHNSICEDRLTALAMISIEKLFISGIENFNEKVIDEFAKQKTHRIELMFKK